MALPTGATTTSTTNYSTARYSKQIRKTLFEYGENLHRFHDLADKGKLEPGHTNQYQINRRRRIAISNTFGGASEGLVPNPTTLQVDTVTGTSTQYVLVVQFTDVAELYQFHDLLEDASKAVKDAMLRLTELIMSGAYTAATNTVFPGSITTVATITASDIINTNQIQRCVSALRTGDATFGAAAPYSGAKMAGILHTKAVMDLQADSVWTQYASRQKPELLEKGIISDWMGVNWYETNWMPEYTNIGTTAALAGITSVSTPGATSGIVNAPLYAITRKHVNRGFEEGIMSLVAAPSWTSGDGLNFTTPSDTNYVYNVYFSSVDSATQTEAVQIPLLATGTVAGGASQTLQNVAASQAIVITALATVATNYPPCPATTVTVLPFWVMGKGAVSTVDLSALEVFITPRVSTPTDPAVQNRYVAAKFHMGSFLQQNAWIRQGFASTSM